MQNLAPITIKETCINCENEIDAERLDLKIPCKLDIPDESVKDLTFIKDDFEFLKSIYRILKERKRLLKFKDFYEIEKDTKDFIDFFKSILGSDPWSIQIAWFKRLVKKESFSMIAPTGIGKTTFILISSIFFALKRKRIYMILPTTVLVEQAYEKALNYIEKIKKNIRIVVYLKNTKKVAKELIEKGEFDILITSNQFLSKNFEILEDKKFDFIFIDDVDAFFKSSKNIDRVIQLLGFSEKDLEKAYQLIKAKQLRNEEKIKKLSKIIEEIKNKDHGCLILSSATGRVRGQRVKLYRELLNFMVGAGISKIRNIIDTYIIPKNSKKEILLKLIEKLEDGILIFVPRDKGSEYAKEVYEFLRDKNINVGLAISGYPESSSNIEKFAKGEINVLIGVAHFYGLLVRGLDLPTRVKYVIFLGTPKIRINLTKQEKSLQNTLILGNIIQEILPENERRGMNTLLRVIQNQIKKLSAEALRTLSEAFQNNTQLEGWLENLRKNVDYLFNKINDYLSKKEIIEKLKEHPDVSLKIEEDNIYLQIPDIKTYIQASGRSSRLYAGGITKGLSIIIVDDEKLLRSLERRLKFYFD